MGKKFWKINVRSDWLWSRDETQTRKAMRSGQGTKQWTNKCESFSHRITPAETASLYYHCWELTRPETFSNDITARESETRWVADAFIDSGRDFSTNASKQPLSSWPSDKNWKRGRVESSSWQWESRCTNGAVWTTWNVLNFDLQPATYHDARLHWLTSVCIGCHRWLHASSSKDLKSSVSVTFLVIKTWNQPNLPTLRSSRVIYLAVLLSLIGIFRTWFFDFSWY